MRRVPESKRETGLDAWLDAAAPASLALVACILYWKIVRLWWMFDDAAHLRYIETASPLAFLFSSGFWQHFIAPMFTPLLLLSLWADHGIFGRNAAWFYGHQLLGVMAIGPVLYWLLRLWLPRRFAFLAALAAILGVPVIQITQLLMLRHYVEGLLLAMLAASAFALAGRRDDTRLSVASAVLALLAMLAKEIFVPLGMVLAMLPGARRRRLLVPQAIALGVYTLWRLAVLGPALHAYGWTVRAAEWPRVIGSLPLRAIQTLAAGTVAGWLLVVVLLAMLLLLVVQRPRSRVIIAVGLVCAVAPVIPVSIELQPRYALALWLLLVITAAFAAAPMPRAGIGILTIIVLAAFATNRATWPSTYRLARRMSDEARILSMMRPGDLLFDPATPPGSLENLRQLTRSPGQWSFDEQPLCGHPPGGRLFMYEAKSSEVKAGSVAILEGRCHALRVMPLAARFEADGTGSLFWTLAPYHDGRYLFLLAGGTQAFAVPPAGGFRLPNVEEMTIRVRYESPSGWTTESPDLHVPLRAGSRMAWAR